MKAEKTPDKSGSYIKKRDCFAALAMTGNLAAMKDKKTPDESGSYIKKRDCFATLAMTRII
jgi:hypothetical protein